MPRTLPLSLIVGPLLLGAGADAIALGFGRSGGQHMLGQALSFSIPVRLDDDESLAPSCAAAEVFAGDQRLAPANVRASVEPGREPNERVVRVVTNVTLDEPVVNVNVSVGCPPRLTRSFVLFLDPPTVQYAAQGEPMALPQAPESTAGSTGAAQASRTTPGASPAVSPIESALPQQAASAPRTARRSPRPTSVRNTASSAPRPTSTAAAQSRPARSGAGHTGSTASAAGAAPSASAGQARLRLDPLEPSFAADAIATAAANAASAASAAAEAARAASAAAEANARARALEESVARLRAESKREQDNLAAMRARLSEAEARQYSNPVTYMLAATAALLLLALFFLWRQRSREREAGWWKDAEPVGAVVPAREDFGTHAVRRPSGFDHASAEPDAEMETGPTPFTTSGSPLRMPVTQPAPIAPATIIPPQAVEPRREVTVEELIDLEQQAEFFIVLGQDEAAVDLLMGHLRSTGGISPLPYLKLLEIYRRRNERESYERVRERFNHRFNAYAPDWDSDLNKGRSLDDYPEVTDRLQKLWREPSGSMAELESLLFRKVQEGPTFDLPAYREVLFLYSLARDLQEHEPGGVDLLLPLDEADHSVAAEPLVSSPATTTMALHGPLEWETSELSPPHQRPAPGGDLDIDLDLGIQLDFEDEPKKNP